MSEEYTYHILKNEEGDNTLTVYFKGELPVVVQDDHPRFWEAVDACLEDWPAEDVQLLTEPVRAISDKFEQLSERVTLSGRNIHFDGDVIHNSITKHIVRFLDEGVEDWAPLVNFLEKIAANPNKNSREQLYNWLDAKDFTILPDGDIIGYKGVESTDDGVFLSIHSGSAIVNNEKQDGRIKQEVGDVVQMPRSEVNANPSEGCSHGLHVGTHEYAKGYSRNGGLLKVRVNPRDVVSVPNDSSFAKLRTCRYVILEVTEGRTEAPVEDFVDYENGDVDEWSDPYYIENYDEGNYGW